ncbi:hypothetical protein DENSPDRAFT_887010 [Dentipellis sp. KUC8613]|nr:hypothetical protein DENSPDRAFT_887010 [Dentipellis sp. KUC8613]
MLPRRRPAPLRSRATPLRRRLALVRARHGLSRSPTALARRPHPPAPAHCPLASLIPAAVSHVHTTISRPIADCLMPDRCCVDPHHRRLDSHGAVSRLCPPLHSPGAVSSPIAAVSMSVRCDVPSRALSPHPVLFDPIVPYSLPLGPSQAMLRHLRATSSCTSLRRLVPSALVAMSRPSHAWYPSHRCRFVAGGPTPPSRCHHKRARRRLTPLRGLACRRQHWLGVSRPTTTVLRLASCVLWRGLAPCGITFAPAATNAHTVLSRPNGAVSWPHVAASPLSALSPARAVPYPAPHLPYLPPARAFLAAPRTRRRPAPLPPALGRPSRRCHALTDVPCTLATAPRTLTTAPRALCRPAALPTASQVSSAPPTRPTPLRAPPRVRPPSRRSPLLSTAPPTLSSLRPPPRTFPRHLPPLRLVIAPWALATAQAAHTLAVPTAVWPPAHLVNGAGGTPSRRPLAPPPPPQSAVWSPARLVVAPRALAMRPQPSRMSLSCIPTVPFHGPSCRAALTSLRRPPVPPSRGPWPCAALPRPHLPPCRAPVPALALLSHIAPGGVVFGPRRLVPLRRPNVMMPAFAAPPSCHCPELLPRHQYLPHCPNPYAAIVRHHTLFSRPPSQGQLSAVRRAGCCLAVVCFSI